MTFPVAPNRTEHHATVAIKDVVPEAQEVPLHALVEGDSVFDAFGGTHRITQIWVTRKVHPVVWIERDDRRGYPECLGLLEESRYDTITIIPSFEARR